MQIWVSNISTDDQSIAVSKSKTIDHYSFTMLWNKYMSVIYKYQYHYTQENKLYEWLKGYGLCLALLRLLFNMHVLLGFHEMRNKTLKKNLQQMSACSSLPSKQSSSPSQRQRSWIQRLLLHWNCSALHNCGGISPCLTTKYNQDAQITCQLDTTESYLYMYRYTNYFVTTHNAMESTALTAD